MNSFKSLSFLLGTIVFLLIPETSYAKETWLYCGEDETMSEYLIYLDDIKEVFEVRCAGCPATFQGKANFSPSSIKFDFTATGKHRGGVYKYLETMTIYRDNLKYYASTQYIVPFEVAPRVPVKGSCKIVPAPSKKRNLI